MYILKKLNMIGFDLAELKSMFKDAKLEDVKREIASRGYSFDDFRNDNAKMQEITDILVEKGKRDKENIEVFTAIEMCHIFYPEDSKILFPLKDSYDPIKHLIKTLKDLKRATKEGSQTDFAIMSSDGLRQFQLKQYQGKLNTNDIIAYLEKRLGDYGNNLGQTNLLILLQGDGEVTAKIEFKKIHERLSTLGLSIGEVMILYNELNRCQIINQVYPELRSRREKISPEYLMGIF